MGTGGPFHRG